MNVRQKKKKKTFKAQNKIPKSWETKIENSKVRRSKWIWK